MDASELVTLEDLRSYLGVDSPEDELVLERLRESTLAAFLAACGRETRPFAGAQTGRVERHDGTGTNTLWLDYPIDRVTAVSIDGVALDPTDTDVMYWARGGSRLVRTDGGTWGTWEDPGVVSVTYDTLDDLPADARLAVIRRVAALYRESGRPEATAERMLLESADLPPVGVPDPVWDRAVAAHRTWRVA